MGVVATVAAGALAAVGYCVYFDKKRRSDPDYKKKIRERRQKAKEQASPTIQWPSLSDPESISQFMMMRLQMGEDLLSAGKIEEGTDMMAQGLVVCGAPQQLLSMMQQQLPTEIFRMLLVKIPKMGKAYTQSTKNDRPRKVIIEDVE